MSPLLTFYKRGLLARLCLHSERFYSSSTLDCFSPGLLAFIVAYKGMDLAWQEPGV